MKLTEEFIDSIKFKGNIVEVRAICDLKGNMYAVSFEKSVNQTILHKNAFDVLKKLKKLKGTPEDFYLFKDGRKLLGLNLIQNNGNEDEIKKILKKVGQINKDFKFIPKSIVEAYLSQKMENSLPKFKALAEKTI